MRAPSFRQPQTGDTQDAGHQKKQLTQSANCLHQSPVRFACQHYSGCAFDGNPSARSM